MLVDTEHYRALDHIVQLVEINPISKIPMVTTGMHTTKGDEGWKMLRAFHFGMVRQLEKKLASSPNTLTTAIDRHHGQSKKGRVNPKVATKLGEQILKLCSNALGVKRVVRDLMVYGTRCDVEMPSTKLGCDVIMACCVTQDVAVKETAGRLNEETYQTALYCWRFVNC